MQKNIPKLRFPEFKGEWKEKKINDIGKIITGNTPPTSNRDFYSDQFMFVSPADINNDRYILNTANKVSKKGFDYGRKINKDGVMVVCIGSTIGKIAQAGDMSITNQQINTIESDTSNSDHFIYYRLLYNSKKIKLLAVTQAVPLLNKADFSNIKILVPLKSEQLRIAEFLGSIDNWIENLKKEEGNQEQHKKAMMQKIFSQEIRFKDENGKDFAKWEEKKLGDIVNFSTAKYFEVDKNHKNGYFLVDMGAITSEGKLLNKKQTKNTSGLLKIDDLVMPNRDIGHGDIIGKVALIDFDDKYVLGSNMYKLSILKDLPKFVYFLINSTLINREMRRRSNGTSQLQLIRKDVETVKVRIPDRDEQQKIVNFLTSVDKVIESKEQQIALAENWKKGLMQRMFI